MVVALTRSMYALSVLSIFQVTGWLDYRLAYAALCYLLWQALAFKYPIQTTYVESQAAWYTLKGVTIVGRTCKPALNWTRAKLLSPGSNKDVVSLVDKHGTTVQEYELDGAFPTSAFPFRPDAIAPSKVPEYEFAIYEWTTPEESDFKSVIMRRKSVKDISDNFQFSNIKLLAPRIVLGKGGTREGEIIDMADDFRDRNYYICGNTLFDRPFVAWFLKQRRGDTLDDAQDYKVEFIDNNMSEQAVLPGQSVIIQKDCYAVIEAQPDHPTLRKRSSRLPGDGKDRDGADAWAAENAYIRAGKEALDKATVRHDDVPSHKKYPWAQLY